MLDSITIKNFKAIQEKDGLALNNLTQVNYLVDPNGCGKSSILEGVIVLKNLHLDDSESKILSTTSNGSCILLDNIFSSVNNEKALGCHLKSTLVFVYSKSQLCNLQSQYFLVAE
jgi:AAA15 family ATPase/GTPase